MRSVSDLPADSATGPSLVRLDSISKSFDRRSVFRDFNFRIDVGEFVAIMGPSGSGKSTLLAIASGVEAPDEGQRVATNPQIRQCWLLQSSPMLARRTVQENVALGPLSFGIPRDEAVVLAHEALETLDIAQLASSRAFRLSGGERQRMVVARSIAARAELVIADEPTASLDAVNRDLVVNALERAAQLGGGVMVATHDPWVADRADRVIDLSFLTSARHGTDR